MKEKHSEDTSSPIASAAALNSSTPHTKPQADENYATAEIRPRKASTEGLQEDWVPGTEVVGKYDFPVSAAHVSTCDIIYIYNHQPLNLRTTSIFMKC